MLSVKARIAILIFISPILIQAQKIIEVKDVRGEALIDGDVSVNQAKKSAINEAKVEALKKAGIDEHISSYQMLYTSQQKNDFAQFFNNDIQSEIQGAVKSFTIKKEGTEINPNTGKPEYKVLMDATVIKYESKPDPSFDVSIDGIKGVYNNFENLEFSIKPSEDCYLNIFNITDTEASLMFPNKFDKKEIFEKSAQYSFPRNKKLFDYSLETKKKQEMNRFIFVFTKKEFAYVRTKNEDQVTEPEQIFSWLYSIPPDQRKVYYIATIIQN